MNKKLIVLLFAVLLAIQIGYSYEHRNFFFDALGGFNGFFRHGITGYTAFAGGGTNTSNLTIWDETDTGMPFAGLTRYAGNQTQMFANYTNATDGSIINETQGNCTINFTASPTGPFNMTFNTTNQVFQFNRSFSSRGDLYYTIECYSPTFSTLDATDFVVINNTAPTETQPVLNSTDAFNRTSGNLNAYTTVSDVDADSTTSIYNWYRDNISIAVLNMPFDTNDSSGAEDYSGYGNNGTIEGSTPPVWQSNCVVGGCYNFTNAGYGNINLTGTPLLGFTKNNNFTVEVWIKTNGLPWGGAQAPAVIAGYNWPGPTGGFTLEGPSSGSNLNLYMYNGAGYGVIGTPSLNNGRWYYFAFGYDGTKMFLYQDGVLVGTSVQNPDNAGESSMYIGTAPAGPTDPNRNWNGLIDEVRIYNRSLSAAEILLHNSTHNETASSELNAGDNWSVAVTPNDAVQDGTTLTSNTITILALTNAAPTQTQPILNSTFGTNTSSENLTVYTNITDSDGDNTTTIYNWYVNNTSYGVLNMPFDTNSSTTVRDYSGYNNTGGDNGAVWIPNGKFGGAYQFTTNTAYINTTQPVIDPNRDFTFTAWAKLTQTNVCGVSAACALFQSSQDSTHYWAFGAPQPPTGSYILQYADGGSAQFSNSSTVHINDNNWHFIVYRRHNNILNIYVDGTDESDIDLTSITLNSGNAQTIGAGLIRGGDPQIIDQVEIFNRSLSDAELAAMQARYYNVTVYQELKRGDVWSVAVTPNDALQDGNTTMSNNVTILNSPPTETRPILNSTSGTNTTSENLTAYTTITDVDNDNTTATYNWILNGTSIAVLNMPFDTNSSSNVEDYSGYGNNGTNYGASWISNGELGGAYVFDGTSSNITVGTQSSLDIPTGGNVTMCAWINVSSYTNANGDTDQGVLAKRNTVLGTGYAYGMNFNHALGVFRVYTSGSSGVQQFSYVPPLNQWTFVCGIISSSNATAFYVNGALFGTAGTGGGVTSIPTAPLAIGTSGQYYEPFNGTIDMVTVYNKTLSAGEISLLNATRYNETSSSELSVGDNWSVAVTPNDAFGDGTTITSNTVTIVTVNAPPTQTQPILNSTFGTNTSSENLTVYTNTTDSDGDNTTAIYNWYVNNQSYAALNMPFDTDSSTTVEDYSANRNNGSFVGSGVVWQANGKMGGAYNFTDTSSYISVPYNSGTAGGAFNANGVTVEAYIYPVQAFSGTDQLVFINEITSNLACWDVLLDYSGTGVAEISIVQNGAQYNARSGSYAFSLNQWHHFVGRATPAGRISVWVDGVKLDDEAIPGSGFRDCGANPSDIGNGLPGVANPFNGSIDNVVVYDRALSDQEILLHNATKFDTIGNGEFAVGDNWSVAVTPNDAVQDGSTVFSNNITVLASINTPPTQTQPILNSTFGTNTTSENLTVYTNITDSDRDSTTAIYNWYVNNASIALLNMPFDTNSSSVARDYASANGDNNNGTVNGAVWTSGVSGGAYSFNGVSDYISVPNRGYWDFSGDFTIEAWVKFNGFNSGYYQNAFVAHDQGSGGQPKWMFTYDPSGQATHFEYYNGGSQELSGNTWAASTGVWYFLAVKRKGNTYYFYRNGLPDGSVTDSVPIQTASASLTIGTSEALSLNGVLDNVVVYNRSLSDAEILLHNSTHNETASSELSVGDNWSVAVTPNDALQDGNTTMSNNVTILNIPPTTPVQISPAAAEIITNRTPFFNWSASTDADNDPINYTLLVYNDSALTNLIINTTTLETNFTPASDLYFGTYYWKVGAYDGYAYNYSGISNFTIITNVACSLPTNSVDFGNVALGQTENTTSDAPPPLLIENNGNLKLNVSINSTSLWTSVSNPSTYYLFRIGTDKNGSFDSALNESWYEFTSDAPNESISGLKYQSVSNDARIDVQITPPQGEGSGTKSSTVNVYCERDE